MGGKIRIAPIITRSADGTLLVALMARLRDGRADTALTRNLGTAKIKQRPIQYKPDSERVMSEQAFP